MSNEQYKFIGRTEELGALTRLYTQPSPHMVVVYGRRRIGKSRLLTHFCKDKRHIFFTGRKGEAQKQIAGRFLMALGSFYNNPLIQMAHVENWSEIFEILDIARRREKLIVVLDEFQWMCPRSSTLISSLQEHWDKKWKNSRGVFLVLCGSIVSFMEKEILSEKSPLYGRRTASMEIGPLPPAEAKLFFPKQGIIEQCGIIMTFGGVPSYLEIINPHKSLAQNINSMALTKHGYFLDEIQFILREQLKNPKRYYILLKKLAMKSMSRQELAKATGIANSGSLHLYLKTLTDLKLIKQVIPIDKPVTTKMQRYTICDEFLSFYFSYILPNREVIEMNSDDWLYDRLIAPTWDAYCGHSFEFFCSKNIRAIVNCLGIKDVFKRSGTYWRPSTLRSKGVQIDLVIERADQVTHLIECKWLTGKAGLSIAAEIGKKKPLYPNPLNHTIKTAIITTHGITLEARDSGMIDSVITLKELFSS